jgi:small-conductance mechanosensitive channel
MFAFDPNSDASESGFRVLRTLLAFVIFAVGIATARWGVRRFVLRRSGPSPRFPDPFAVGNAIVLVLLVLLRVSAERLLLILGSAIANFRANSDLAWVGPMLVGTYFALIATSVLLLTIRLVGLTYSFFEDRINVTLEELQASGKAVRSNPRFHASRILKLTYRIVRNLVTAALLVAYVFYGFMHFPRTRVVTTEISRIFGPPIQRGIHELENYGPNLGYLLFIFLFGWIMLRGLKYFFSAIRRGNIVLEHFPADWADPTYKLCRFILFLFVLMVAFPYLPGAGTPFFRGFSLFVGALVTFGSSGAISNLFAGILLTYARAFRVGDVVQIEGVYGRVAEKTLLVTRIVTTGNEQVSIPNSKVVNESVTNYSAHGAGDSVAMGVSVTIGYDVDWRIVHKLLIDAATRTAQAATDPPPAVMERSLDNYSVDYELRVFSKTADGIFESYAALRRNVLDTFADAGVEIMTPTILSHRDASSLAVPGERFPIPPAKGIRVSVQPSDQAGNLNPRA